MLEQSVLVVRQTAQGTVVKAQAGVCQSCSQQNGCGTKTLATWLSEREQGVTLDLGKRFEAGQQLLLGIDETGVIGASFWLYLAPLLSAFIAMLLLQGIAAGLTWLQHDAAYVIAALVGGYIGQRLAKPFVNNAALAKSVRLIRVLTPVLHSQSDGACAQLIVKSRA